MEILRDRREEFDRVGVKPLGISRDSPWTHISWMQALDLNFGLLSDWNAEAVRGFGVSRDFRGFQGHRPADGVPGGRGGDGPGDVELRGLGGPGLRRADRSGRRVVALAVAIFAVAAVLAAVPGIEHIGERVPRRRRARATGRRRPATICRPRTTCGSSATRSSTAATRGATRTRSGRRRSRRSTPPSGRTASSSGRSTTSSASCSAGTCSSCSRSSRPACSPWRGCASSGSRCGPAIVGGLAFEIAPYRAVQSAGHLLGPISLLLPLSLWALERGRRGNPAWLALSAVAIASIPLSGQVHLAIGAVPFYAAYALVRLPGVTVRRCALPRRRRDRRRTGDRRRAAHRSRRRPGLGERERTRSLSAVAAYSASWLDFFSRSQRHGSESFVFLGWLTPLVAMLGLYVLVRIGRAWLAVVLGLGAMIPMLLALGTNTPLYRPVHAVVPGLQYPRVPERLMPVACLAVAALVAFALQLLADDRILGSGRVRVPGVAGRIAIVTAVAVVAIAADLHYEALKATAADEREPRVQGARRRQARLAAPGGARLPCRTPTTAACTSTTTPSRDAKRPSGYSTTAPVIADVTARRLQGDQLRGLDARGRGSCSRSSACARSRSTAACSCSTPPFPGASWFAWRGLVQHGYRRWAQDGAITMLDRLHGHGPAPKAPVARAAPRHGAALRRLVRQRRERPRDVRRARPAVGVLERPGQLDLARHALVRAGPGDVLRRRPAGC